MAITMFIERPAGTKSDPNATDEITLKQWKRAVEKVDGVRLAEGDGETRHPFTGQIIRVPNTGGDAEVRVRKNRWVRAFVWQRDYVVFEIRTTEDGEDPIFVAAQQLARQLKAEIRDEDGYYYER